MSLVFSSRVHHKFPYIRESWLELVVYDSNQNILYSFGNLASHDAILDVITLPFYFTMELLDAEDGDIIFTASVAQDYTKRVLPTFGSVYDIIEINTENWDEVDNITITARMLFRAYKPSLLENHPEMLQNLKIFEMDSIGTTLSISK